MLNKLKPKSEFSRNVLTLMTGTTIAQAIPIAISPILTRIYTPEDFGVFALYMSLLFIFSPLVTGRYELSILIPKQDDLAKHLVFIVISLSLFITFILLLLVIIFADAMVALLDNQNIRIWLYLAPVNIFILSATSSLYYYNNRHKNYKTLSKNQIIQSSTQGFLNIIIGLFLKFKAGLIIGSFISHFISFLFLFRKTKGIFKKFKLSKVKVFFLLKKYSDFPKFMMPSSIIESTSSQLPVLMLGSFFGPHTVGLYSLSQRVIKLPIGIIGSSMGNVFRQEAMKQLQVSGNCRFLFLKTFKILILIATIPFLLFYYIAPELFGFVFGENWYIAGEYAQILMPMFYLQFIISPLTGMFIIAEKQKYDLYLQFYLIIGVFSSFYCGYILFNNVEYSLYFFTFIYSIKYIVEFMLAYSFTEIKNEGNK